LISSLQGEDITFEIEDKKSAEYVESTAISCSGLEANDRRRQKPVYNK